MSFINPTAFRNRLNPAWLGPTLPQSTNRGNSLALVDPSATVNIQASGPIFPSPASYRAALLSSIRMIFGTRPGERLFLPDFGLNMDALIFETADTQTTTAAESAIRSAIEKFEPRVSLIRVDTQLTPNTNAIIFTVTMQVRGSTPDDVLSYSTSSSPTT